MSEKKPRLIQSVQRALDIINCFDSLHVQLSLTEISEKLNLNISTVYGLIHTLCAYSYMDKNPENGKYRLGLEFLIKANLVSQSLDLKEIGHAHLTELTKKYHETSHLYVYQHEQIFCVDKVESPNNYFIVSSRAGHKLPMHASASGKVFLAHMSEAELQQFLSSYRLTSLTDKTLTNEENLLRNLRQIREQGYGIEDEEIETGAYSIAAPVKDAGNRIVGTISVVGSLARIKEQEEHILTDLLSAAASISNQFGYQPTPTYEKEARI
ncbi:IclR family transcriptional regulator [Paenibacillus sp. CAA11]|uniref:IclR family transcriptional regulator n=1 Tax=Paenibacillus sp. CAA11 TaxID=1532905 RepID=UPI000D39B276|nr:IclR family transcriptional regulator [Paenibacillus sp. CAA11]AWB45585.1 IclR family transcriptional regulator [Paenibacillus sp. CAA11]